jgi:hypothetical protein
MNPEEKESGIEENKSIKPISFLSECRDCNTESCYPSWGNRRINSLETHL